MPSLHTYGLDRGILALIVAFVLSVVLVPRGIRLAWRLGVVDRPVGDKIHARTTPLMGGVAIALAFLITVAVFLHPWTDQAVAALFFGCALATLLGVTDELLTLKPRMHFIGQVAVVGATITAGFPTIKTVNAAFSDAGPSLHGHSIYLSQFFGFHSLANGQDGAPIVTLVIGVLFTIFWIVGMMNTVNFLDGLDGLAGGVAAIAALFLGAWAVVVQTQNYLPTFDQQNVILPLILGGAILGFLIFNWAPARVFMGDSGAMFIGFALGALSIFGPVKLGTGLLLLVIPIIDVAWAIVRRLLGRRSFASGDKHHIYHRMLEMGLSRRAVVLIFYALCIALGLIDLHYVRTAKVFAFGIVALVVFAAAVVLEVRGQRAAARARKPASDLLPTTKG